MFLEDSHPVRLLSKKTYPERSLLSLLGADFLNGTAPQRFVGLIKGRLCALLFRIPIFFSLMEAFVAAQNSAPVYPIPRFLPRELELEGHLDVYEPARVLFRRVLKFVRRPAYANLSSAEIHLFLKEQVPYLVSVMLPDHPAR